MDSDYSDDDSVIIRHELDCAQDAIVSSSGAEEETQEALIVKDRLLRRTVEVPEPELASRKDSSYISIKQNNWGANFDPYLATFLDKVQSFNDEIDKPTTAIGDDPKIQTPSLWEGRNVSPQYIDVVLKESISGRYVDWHFITQDSEFEDVSLEQEFLADGKSSVLGEILRKRYPTMEHLWRSFGVSQSSLESVNALDQRPLTNNRCHDSLCSMSPVETMLRALEVYSDGGTLSLGYLIGFFLDRKVWESMELSTHWCYRLSRAFTAQQIIDEYLNHVERRDYFMHYRLVRLLPNLHSPLVRQLLGPEITQAIVQEFEQLIDDKLYQPLLYFSLFVYGSRFISFGASPTTQHFKDCIDDLCNQSTNAVELSLLRGILGLFLKIT